jgi:hypothetical protein
MSSGLLCCAICYKLTNVSEVLTSSIIRAYIIALMMEAVNISDTSVNFYETSLRNVPKESSFVFL